MLGISYRGLHIVDASPNLLVNWSWNEFDDI